MDTFYTDERNIQMLIYLMKVHNIKKVVASPGTTNISFVASIQQDPFFEIYSSVDERSAAYIACGLAAESGEHVALSCTGATASRNYIPALTEAFYRKLPILAITSTKHMGYIGQNTPQVIDRSIPLNDIARMSVLIPTIHDEEDEWIYGVKLNAALLELCHRGGGPVHINLTTTYSINFTVKELRPVRVINRICSNDVLPELKCGRVGIFVGAHRKWSDKLTRAVDDFCEAYNGAVICDHTSNYQGKYRIFFNLVTGQSRYISPCRNMDIMIDMGDISGAYIVTTPSQVWRVNPDGEVRDTHRKLRFIFEMEEADFFNKYVEIASDKKPMSYYTECRSEYERILAKVTDLPFSNVWIAKQTCSLLPENCVLHLGILNSLRSWNFFETSISVLGYSNTGGFGIDGGVSSLIGASLACPQKLFFGVVGDLAFFYDMNAVGNRHVGSNLRLIVVNNGRGTEFKNYNNNAAIFGDAADSYMSAAGHYGKQSIQLLKHYSQDLGFEYLSASNKEEYMRNLERFITPETRNQPTLFEVFTDSKDESDALYLMNNIEVSVSGVAKEMAKKMLGEKGVKTLKKIFNE